MYPGMYYLTDARCKNRLLTPIYVYDGWLVFSISIRRAPLTVSDKRLAAYCRRRSEIVLLFLFFHSSEFAKPKTRIK